MKVDMSPNAIGNRLKLVGELIKACLLIRRNSFKKPKTKEFKNNFSNQTEKKTIKF